MTFKFISAVKTEITSLLPDNSTGVITPAALRTVVNDMTDSLYNRNAAVYADHVAVPVAQAITTVPTNYPTLYTTSFALDPTVIAANISAGTCIPAVTGFACDAAVGSTMNGTVNRIVTAQVLKNGSVVNGAVIKLTMTGVGENHSGYTEIPMVTVAAGDIFTVVLSADANFTPNILSLLLVVRVKPTFSAV